jgi:ArsR family transcriptional regulator
MTEAGTADRDRDRDRDCDCDGDSRARIADRCGPRAAGLDERAVRTDVRLLATVGNDTRYETLRLVAGADEDGICVCDLEPALGVSQGAVSQALSRLSAADLVDRRTSGRSRYYTATERAERLLAALDGLREADDDR